MLVYEDRLWCVKLLHSVSIPLSPSPLQAGFTPLCPCVPGCCSDRLVVAFLLGAALNETPAGQLCWHRLRSLLPSHRAFLPPLLPEHCSVLTVSLFPVVLQWQNTRQALTAHFALAWRTSLAFVLLAGLLSEVYQCSQCSIQDHICSLLSVIYWVCPDLWTVQKTSEYKDRITWLILIFLAGENCYNFIKV